MNKPKRPRDPNQLAHLIAAIATGEAIEPQQAGSPDKDPAAVSLGRRGGLLGGVARAKAMTPERRREIAAAAAKKRWAAKEEEPPN
jgi:hypothetical protein